MRYLLPLLSGMCLIAGCSATSPQALDPHDPRVRGLLLGSMIGDALGGPVEFVPVDQFDQQNIPFQNWQAGETLGPDFRDYSASTKLMSYTVFRPEPEPYAHWRKHAPPGTLTDDTRHKAVAVAMLRAWVQQGGNAPFKKQDLAKAYLTLNSRWSANGDFRALAIENLAEYVLAARWVLGERELSRALPPSRLWGGLDTCAGQMLLLPLAGVAPGEPEAAYRITYDIAFIDNGIGRDLNAAIVAGLSQALVTDPQGPEAWAKIYEAMKQSDTYRYAEVPWVPRSVDRWLQRAQELAQGANHSPAALRAAIDAEFAGSTWWEAHVTFVMSFAAMEFCNFDPIASMRLAVELGHDTDSTAQLVGAFMGALHGTEVFPEHLSEPVMKAVEPDISYTFRQCVDAIAEARAKFVRIKPSYLRSARSQ